MNDGFGVSKVVTSTQDKEEEQGTRKTAKKFEDVELQVLLDEDDSQKQLVEQLDVSQQAVSNRVREMEKIQETDKWVPHELNDKKMKKRKNTCNILIARYRR